jgi:ABC-type uncharacterized transport system permease subunit
MLYVSVFIHIVYIGIFTKEAGHCLHTSVYELFSLIAFTLVAVYTIVEVRRKQFAAGTGLMVVTVSFVFQLLSSFNTSVENISPSESLFTTPAFTVHIITAVFGYASLTLATIYGSLYLLLYRSMKRNTYGSFFFEVPSLDTLELYGVRSSLVGFIFLTVSIGAGAVLFRALPEMTLAEYLFDTKIIATILIWIVFGSTYFLHKYKKLEGSKIVVFWMSGFILTLLSMTVVNMFTTAFHSFF